MLDDGSEGVALLFAGDLGAGQDLADIREDRGKVRSPASCWAGGVVLRGQVAAAGTLIKDLVAEQVIAPLEPWIRGSLGLPERGK